MHASIKGQSGNRGISPPVSTPLVNMCAFTGIRNMWSVPKTLFKIEPVTNIMLEVIIEYGKNIQQANFKQIAAGYTAYRKEKTGNY
jgi:hypothetical protein